MTQVIRLLLVDDHALLRGALAERLDREPGLTVVAQAASADEAIHKADALAPDVILMDIDMPGKLCFEAAQAMRATHPRVRIIILSAYMHDWYVERALEIGASGYLTKGESAETVIAAVQAAANGGEREALAGLLSHRLSHAAHVSRRAVVALHS
jgi:DNA-binding NarL/FixJ family response regulator